MRVNHLTPTLEVRGPGPRAAVKGWIEWKLIGRDGKVKQAGQQHNLFLNKGLDRVLANLPSGFMTCTAITNVPAYVAVGTGSVAPAVTDTALQTEVARTNATLSAGNDLGLTVLGNGQYRFSRTRTFDYNQANGNLTEFGASDSSSSANGVLTRELFRDGSNNPIVITKTSNERLAITYNVEITFSPVSEQAGTINLRDNSNAIVATLNVRSMFHRYTGSGGTGDLRLVSQLTTSGFVDTGNYIMQFATGSMPQSYAYSGSVSSLAIGDLGWQTYVNGNYYRDCSNELGPESADRNIYGYWSDDTRQNGIQFGVRFCDASGADQPFLKNKDYRLKLAFRFSIARV